MALLAELGGKETPDLEESLEDQAGKVNQVLKASLIQILLSQADLVLLVLKAVMDLLECKACQD